MVIKTILQFNGREKEIILTPEIIGLLNLREFLGYPVIEDIKETDSFQQFGSESVFEVDIRGSTWYLVRDGKVLVRSNKPGLIKYLNQFVWRKYE